MKIALTADWLVTKGGAERVLSEMLTLWPQAPLFTTVYKEDCLAPLKPGIRTSTLQRWYKLIGDHRVLLPWMPRAVESWDLREFDVVVSSSHAVAKGCIPESNAVHICYCHTPMRYAWEMEDEYLDDFRLRGPLRALIKRQLDKLRAWDLQTAKRVDRFIANSHEVSERIQKNYGRESIILPPPVDERFFNQRVTPSSMRDREKREIEMRIEGRHVGHHSKLANRNSKHFLALGRLVPYKRFDLLIRTANTLQLPLMIVGTGPEEKRLRAMAGPTVTFLGHASDEELPTIYTSARALLFPVHEDAGIVPLEAQACGIPVIALGKGGTLDTVKEGETGLFFAEQTEESLTDAIRRFEKIEFNAKNIREHAKKFSSARFRKNLQKIVEDSIGNYARSS